MNSGREMLAILEALGETISESVVYIALEEAQEQGVAYMLLAWLRHCLYNKNTHSSCIRPTKDAMSCTDISYHKPKIGLSSFLCLP